MNRLTIIYERKQMLYVVTQSQTTAGLWVMVDPCSVLPSDSQTTLIGEAALKHLSRSQTGIPHPSQEEWRNRSKPFLAAANVKSWSTFNNSARCVDVSGMEGTIKITPTRNEHPGFGFLVDEAIMLSEPISVESLGEAVRHGLKRSE